MPKAPSLKLRFLAAFALLGGLLGPLIAATLLLVTFVLEQRALGRALEARVGQVVESPADFELKQVEGFADTHVLAFARMGSLPREMFELPDGVHEYEAGSEAWFVALAEGQDGRRYAVVENTTAMEYRERISLLTVGGGTIVAVYLALWLGFRLSRRLLEPLSRLSRQVEAASPDRAGVPMASGFAEDEIGALARALDEYRERMEDAQRREQEFSADVSHELRNPLAIVQNAAELIVADDTLKEPQRRAARRILRASMKMTEIVSGLLLLVREEPQREPNTPLPLLECVESVVEACRNEYPDVDIVFEVHADPLLRAPWVAASSIAANLTRNAAQHAGKRPVIVELRHDCLIVTDEGPGIPPGELAGIVLRGHRASTAVGTGSGVGLSLADRLCQRFGWTLELSSTLNVGTRAVWGFAEPQVSIIESSTERLDLTTI